MHDRLFGSCPEQGWYFAGDGARYDLDGNTWVLGRIDDVMNVSGHRISTAEVESALVGHSHVAEAAVVGASDEHTGQAIIAFVILEAHARDVGKQLVDELRADVAREVSPIACPKEIHVVPELPKSVLGKSQAAVEACCHGLRPGGGSSRRTINPIIAHLIMASLVSGSRS